MGTRSNYRVISESRDNNGKVKNEKLLNLYVQFDGYPEGHPLDTVKWLSTGKVVNGFSHGESQLQFNGVGCLAAQLVERLKDGVGNTYIHPISNFGMCGEDYMYDIIVTDDMKIKVIAYQNTTKWESKRVSMKKLFEGSPEEYIQHFDKI